jgi:hypothetical protein
VARGFGDQDGRGHTSSCCAVRFVCGSCAVDDVRDGRVSRVSGRYLALFSHSRIEKKCRDEGDLVVMNGARPLGSLAGSPMPNRPGGTQRYRCTSPPYLRRVIATSIFGHSAFAEVPGAPYWDPFRPLRDVTLGFRPR